MFRENIPKPIEEDLHDILYNHSESLSIVLPEKFDDYICAISYLMLFEPVAHNACGNIFERSAIERWQQQQANDGEEKQEAHYGTCPKCRGPLVHLTPNAERKNEISDFLTQTKAQLIQDVRNNPADPNNEDRQNIIRLCTHFMQHGNNEATLKTKFKEFCVELSHGHLKNAACASQESSKMASALCRIL